MLCGTQNGCWGESGSPVICKKALVGILSWNSGCEMLSPAVMEDVHINIPWLENITGANLLVRSEATRNPPFYAAFLSIVCVVCMLMRY